MSKIVMGIDPGASGGIAASVDLFGSLFAKPCAISMPDTDGDIRDLFEKVKALGAAVTVYLEDVPKLIRFGPGPSGMRPNTDCYGQFRFLVGLAIANRFQVVLVTPKKWQKPFSMHRGAAEDTVSWKNRLKGISQNLYPDLRVTKATADALLILYYGMKEEGANLNG